MQDQRQDMEEPNVEAQMSGRRFLGILIGEHRTVVAQIRHRDGDTDGLVRLYLNAQRLLWRL